MRRIILMLGLAWSLSFPAAAHQCTLEGSNSEAIPVSYTHLTLPTKVTV